MCFLGSCGYFKATRKFFSGHFHERDITYVALRLGVKPNQVVPSSYHKQTYLRHQKLILEFFGFSPFDDAARAFISPEIEDMVKAQLKPRLIFSRTVEQLIREKISPPGYDALSKLILHVLNDHKEHLIGVIELVDIYLLAMQASVNAAYREHKEKCYERRAFRDESLKSLLSCLDESLWRSSPR